LAFNFANAAAHLLSHSCLAPLSASMHFASSHDVAFLCPIFKESPANFPATIIAEKHQKT